MATDPFWACCRSAFPSSVPFTQPLRNRTTFGEDFHFDGIPPRLLDTFLPPADNFMGSEAQDPMFHYSQHEQAFCLPLF